MHHFLSVQISRGLLFGLEVVKENRPLLGFFAPVADDDAGAVDDFTRVAFAVENAYEGEKGLLVRVDEERSGGSWRR